MLNPIYTILLFSLLFRKLTLANETTVKTTSSAEASTGKYIVVLKPNATEDTLQTHLTWMSQHLVADKHLHSSHVQQNSPTTNLSYSSIGGFKWYTGHFHTEAVNSLANGSAQDAVHYVVQDITLNSQEMVQTTAPSWGIDRIDQRHGTDGEYRFPSKQGQGVTIYVIDTGMDISHSDIVGRATHGPTFIGNTSDPTDSNGHGTFVAGVCCGTRYGVAKQAQVVSVKALNSDGDGQLSNVLEAMNWVVQQHQSNPAAKSIIK
jgi:cerevisin